MKTYNTHKETISRDEVIVEPASREVVSEDQTISCYGLGASVAVLVYEVDRGIGGLASVMLPEQTPDAVGAPEKFADTGTQELLKEVISKGGAYTSLVAWIVGGAHTLDVPDLDSEIGLQTVDSVKKQLESLDVTLLDEEVGGESGRTVHFDTSNGTVRVIETAGEKNEIDLAEPEVDA